MTAASERYSDKRVSEDFTCYVLFTEPLQADVAEILAALREDYPALDWPDPLFPGASGPFETGAGSSVVWMGDLRMSLLGGLRRCDVDFDFAKNHLFPGAQQAVAAHQSYLSISVGSAGPSFVDRFQAAKRMTCFAALFAKLPVCSAVYFPNSDGIVAPRRWVEAAERAISDDFPIEQWITFPIARFQPDDDGPPPVSCNSIGMAALQRSRGRGAHGPQTRARGRPPGDGGGVPADGVRQHVQGFQHDRRGRL